MSSWSENYVVVLNRTWTDLSLNQAVINNITHRTVKFIDETRMILPSQQTILQLECINQWRNGILWYLNHGHLAERLVPQEVFSKFEHKLGEHWLPVNWYYHWCIIAHLWNEGWVSQSPVLGYELKEFPLWGPCNCTVKLDIASDAALTLLCAVKASYDMMDVLQQ